jgi:hypothetical protein
MKHYLTEYRKKPIAEKFLDKVIKTNDCWGWKNKPNGRGYSTLSYNYRNVLAHRFSYEQKYGKLEKGMVLDHLCRNRWCVNPDHLQVVSNKENILRGESPSAHNARKTHCPSGHEYNDENTLKYELKLYKGHSRVCRECARLRAKSYRERKKHE